MILYLPLLCFPLLHVTLTLALDILDQFSFCSHPLPFLFNSYLFLLLQTFICRITIIARDTPLTAMQAQLHCLNVLYGRFEGGKYRTHSFLYFYFYFPHLSIIPVLYTALVLYLRRSVFSNNDSATTNVLYRLFT
ncbi:hypothetical protein BDQ17DRAFT_136139 [Cyathus striatus]|nr:hypothetical protein BDQ17DRAFT_136139 [Cyathus striatus]